MKISVNLCPRGEIIKMRRLYNTLAYLRRAYQTDDQGNMMPWTKDAMIHPLQGIVGITGGPLLNKSNMIDLANSKSADETSNQKSLNSPTAPSSPALPGEVHNACEICQEKLELFYEDETEEWNFWDALRVDDKIYHQLFNEDHKETFFKNPALNANNDENDKKTEGSTAAGNKDADDYVEVTVLPNRTPSVSANNNGDKDMSESLPTREKATIELNFDDENILKYKEHEDFCAVDADSSEDDIEIQEPHIPFIDLDTYVEKKQPEDDESSKMLFLNVKIIKEADYYDEDDAFGNIGTMSPTDDLSPHSLERVDATEYTECSSAGTAVITPTELNISIDGNPTTKPLAILGKKIKINLAKSNIMVNSNSNNIRQPIPPPKPSILPPLQEESPSFEIKPAMQGAKLRTKNTVKCGVETSGLCSVM
ncbi:unnamed protein product [Ceratitis capitata]|uniref:(Mediterranean fruit fly) hypothetical protein n=1 Tax=Ceratitis capitata TaxID=7213 RepID=A0A811UFW8_CERCA|nr:unnamed protein product [Ceratitis capitata]